MLFGGFLLCISALALITIKILRPGVKSINDLYFLTAPIKDFNFTDGTKGYRNYRIWLEEYPSTFQINADLLGLFNKTEFVHTGHGNKVKVSIPKKDTLKLYDSKATIFLFSISDSNNSFLDSISAIKKYNSKTDYYYFGGLFIFGCLLLLAGYKNAKK